MGGKTVGRQSWLRWGNRSDKRNRLDRYALHWRSAMHTGWWRKLVNGELAERHASVELGSSHKWRRPTFPLAADQVSLGVYFGYDSRVGLYSTSNNGWVS